MTTTSKKQEADSFYHEPVMIPADADDDFQYEEVAIEDDWSLTEGEEDLEATVRAIQDRAEASAPAAARLDSKPPASDQPEAVDDFLRNFLHKMDMANTLDCFQTEWNEMVQKGLINTERVGLVPAVYIQNQRLDSELKNAQRERKEYQLAASAAAETLLKVQKARDFHRLQHKRVVQEKNRLIEEMRKLKVHCASHEPAIKQMNEKYQTVLRQKMLVKRVKASNKTGESGVRETTHPKSQPRSPDTPRIQMLMFPPRPRQLPPQRHTQGNFFNLMRPTKVWDLQSERCLSTLHGHNGSVYSMDFLSSSKTKDPVGCGMDSFLKKIPVQMVGSPIRPPSK